MTSYKMIIFGAVLILLGSMSLYAYFIPNSYSFDGDIQKGAVEWSVILFNLSKNDTIGYHFANTVDSQWWYQSNLYPQDGNSTVPIYRGIKNVDYVIPYDGNYTLRFFIEYPKNGTLHYWVTVNSSKPNGIDHIIFFGVLAGFGSVSILLSNRKKKTLFNLSEFCRKGECSFCIDPTCQHGCHKHEHKT